VVALLLALPSVGAAQRRDKSQAYDFLLFLQSVASQRMARMCERGVPGYREQFDDRYARWSAKFGARIARGESALRDALQRNDPYTDRATLEQIEKAVAELAQSPSDTSPITLDEHGKALCDRILTELDTGIESSAARTGRAT
jgi:hypothetical protein